MFYTYAQLYRLDDDSTKLHSYETCDIRTCPGGGVKGVHTAVDVVSCMRTITSLISHHDIIAAHQVAA